MAWTIGGVRIYAQESSEETGQILPRLQPLDGGTVIQAFGYESTVRAMDAIVVGDTRKNSLKAFAQTETPVALVSPEGSLGNVIVRKFNARRDKTVCQTIDPALPETAPVYNISFELYIED